MIDALVVLVPLLLSRRIVFRALDCGAGQCAFLVLKLNELSFKLHDKFEVFFEATYLSVAKFCRKSSQRFENRLELDRCMKF